MTPDERMAAIQKLYEMLPPMSSCKGLCSAACTDIDMSELERQRIEHRHQVKIKTRSLNVIQQHGQKKCRALKKDGRCGVYEDRPLICRAWGAIEAGPCPFGCVPDDGRYLTDEEYKGLELAVEQLGGHWYRSDEDRAQQIAFYGTAAGKASLKKQMDVARAEADRLREQVCGDASTEGSDISRKPLDYRHSVSTL